MTELEGDESVRRAERPSEERLLDDERRQARDDQISQPGGDDDDDDDDDDDVDGDDEHDDDYDGDYDDDDKYIMIQCLFVTFLLIPALPPLPRPKLVFGWFPWFFKVV